MELKLKTVLGDYTGLATEIKLMAQRGDIEKIAKLLEEKSGGRGRRPRGSRAALLKAMGEAGLI